MHLDVYGRAVEWKEFGKGYYFLDPLQEKPFRFASVSEMQKGVSQNTDVSGKRKKRLVEWTKNRIYREFSSPSKTLFSILKGSLNSRFCQVRLEIICFRLDRVSSTKARIIYYTRIIKRNYSILSLKSCIVVKIRRDQNECE